MASQWFYQVMGDEVGPISSEELRTLAQRGTISADTLVRKAPDGTWVLADRVQGLFPESCKTPPCTEEVPLPGPQSTKACPNCGETILAVAIKCKHCGSDLSKKTAAKTRRAKSGKRELPRQPAGPSIVVLGSLLVLISMFLPHLSSPKVLSVADNYMIQNLPVDLICCVAGILTICWYWTVGSRLSANVAIWCGMWFFGWTIFDTVTGQLVNLESNRPIETHAGAGLWTVGVGCLLVMLGGLMMRYPRAWFWGFWLLPIIEQSELAGQTRTCPKCAETVKAAASVCRFCGFEFPPQGPNSPNPPPPKPSPRLPKANPDAAFGELLDDFGQR